MMFFFLVCVICFFFYSFLAETVSRVMTKISDILRPAK